MKILRALFPVLVLGALPGLSLEAQETTVPDRESAIRAFEQADRQSFPTPGGVVFVGGTPIARWTTLAQDFPSVRTLNRGIEGVGIRNLISVLDRIVLPYRPTNVVVYSGEEILRGMSGDQIFAAYQELVAMIHLDHPATRITWISTSPSPSTWQFADAMRRANQLVRSFVRGDDRFQYVDAFTPMLGADGTPRRELFMDDGRQLNAAGYAVWREVLSRALEP